MIVKGHSNFIALKLLNSILYKFLSMYNIVPLAYDIT